MSDFSVTTFGDLCHAGYGGLTFIGLIRVRDVVSIDPGTVEHTVGDIQLIDGASVFAFVLAEDESGWSCKPRMTDADMAYEGELRLTLNGDSHAVSNWLKKNKYERFLAIVAQAEGSSRLLGTLESPGRLMPAFSTGEALTDTARRLISFVFSGRDEFAFLQPVLDSALAELPMGNYGGGNGWSFVPALVADGARRVMQVADWIGGTGIKPATGVYVGSSGFVSSIAAAVDFRGPAGADGSDGADGSNGTNGTNGTNGWSPQYALVTDGSRRVLQVSGWTGGTGAAPATGLYVGATGLTAVLADGIDVRGATGATGATGPAGADGQAPTLAQQANTHRWSTHFFTQEGNLVDGRVRTSASGTGASIGILSIDGLSQRGPGLLNQSAGAVSSVSLYRIGVTNGTSTPVYRLGNGTVTVMTVMSLTTLPTDAENYTYTWGLFFGDAVPGNHAAVIEIYCSSGTVTLRARCISGGSATNVTDVVTGAIVAGTQFTLRIVATSTSVQFYRNGTLFATISTNVPGGVGLLALGYLLKTAGSSTRHVLVDYWGEEQTLTSSWTF